MPEGVEIRLSADSIRPLIQNKIIVDPWFAGGRYYNKFPKGFQEFRDHKFHKVIDVNTKGKFMYWSFDSGHYMFCTYGMTGQWSPTISDHPCLVLNYVSNPNEDRKQIYFNDIRHFGTIQFTDNKQKLDKKLKSLGWDPLDHGFTDEDLKFIKRKCSRTKKPIGEILMKQSIFAGVGNYIRAEALYLAKISPWRQSDVMSTAGIQTLCNSIVEVMKDSYRMKGATILTYKDPFGARGEYSSCFKAYRQKTDPTGNLIMKKNTADGRAMYWCPAIQK